ncbi:MAG: MarR family transcriptional regulator [Pirellulales bacterium]|nr:MarR family transcriptional regulator [Pirellulales bacterium]
MAVDADRIKRYLQDTLGVIATVTNWSPQNRLPLFYRSSYQFLQTAILETRCLLMVERVEEALAPAKILKQMEQLRPKWDGELIYVRGQISSHQRKRLIEQKVPFLIPGNQLYLPMLGIDLREYFRQARQISPGLSPATQALVLYFILQAAQTRHTPAELAKRLGYSKMTMTRAFDELEARKLCDISMEGRQRWLCLKDSRHTLWQEALPLLQSPVKKKTLIRRANDRRPGLLAGLSALATYSMLNAPNTHVIAVSSHTWKSLQQHRIDEDTSADDRDSIEVEHWHYDPALLSHGNSVDRLSLYLSMKDNKDERIEAALQEMIGAMEW